MCPHTVTSLPDLHQEGLKCFQTQDFPVLLFFVFLFFFFLFPGSFSKGPTAEPMVCLCKTPVQGMTSTFCPAELISR